MYIITPRCEELQKKFDSKLRKILASDSDITFTKNLGIWLFTSMPKSLRCIGEFYERFTSEAILKVESSYTKSSFLFIRLFRAKKHSKNAINVLYAHIRFRTYFVRLRTPLKHCFLTSALKYTSPLS